MTTPSIKLSPEEKRKFLAQRLKRKKGVSQKSAPQIPKRANSDFAPLSYVQEGLWYLEQLEADVASYNMSAGWRLNGDLNIFALEQSLQALLDRHEILRTRFVLIGGELKQTAVSPLPTSLLIIDLQSLPNEQQVIAIQSHIETESHQPFDLTQPPLLRTSLLRLADNKFIFTITLHHIISDGWSMPIFYRELSHFYTAFCTHTEPSLPPLPIQYADFATWQRQPAQEKAIEKEIAYWRNQLINMPPLLELPTDYSRPASQSYQGEQVELTLPPALVDALRQLSQAHNATLFMTMLAAFNLLIYRLTAQAKIIVGTPMAHRYQPEMEPLIGYFLNNLAIRSDLSDSLSFVELLEQVRQTSSEAYSHARLPFEKLVQILQPARNASHAPIFQIFFNMMAFDMNLTLDALDVAPFNQNQVEIGSKFDITLYVYDQKQKLRLNLVYKTSLFKRERMVELLRQYEQLLWQIVKNPQQKIVELSLVSDSLMSETSRPSLPNPIQPLCDQWHGSVHGRFSQLSNQQPTHTAIIDPHTQWQYGELESRANQLAHHLLAQGIQKGDVIAIYGHRSASLILAWIGILKAGAAFVNLDPVYPTQRLQHYLHVSQAKGIIHLSAAGELSNKLVKSLNQIFVHIQLPHKTNSSGYEFLTEYPTTPPSIEIKADDLAYVAFTSGSTGLPKGVHGRHGSLSHFLPWQAEHFSLTCQDRFSMLSGLSHDPLQRDIFTALWVGGTICIPDTDWVGSSNYLASWMDESRITFAHMTPPMCRILCETAVTQTPLSHLRYTFFVGDKLNRQTVQQIHALAPNVICINSYGATETQRAVAYYEVPREVDNLAHKAIYPLGHGMPDVQLLILNKAQQLAGIGEIGEIHLRSPHLSGGYIGDYALTQERFIPNPFTHYSDDCLYRTGDLGRYLPNGTAVFAGRADRQIKIRGFRVEPGEIEHLLSQQSKIQQAVVIAKNGDVEHVQLIAYLVSTSDETFSLEAVKQAVRQTFPDFMVPSTFIQLDIIPLTPNGKIDFKALPEPQIADSQRQTKFVSPTNAVEEQLLSIWKKLLSIEKISIHDNFFELGGHSLLSIRLFNQLAEMFDKKLPLSVLFQAPTIKDLAEVIGSGETAVSSTNIIPIQPNGTKPPVFLMHGFGGGVVGYGELARLLGTNQPVYGLQAEGFNGEGASDETVTMMAARYMEAIQTIQPTGPYYLGGYCYGGVVAYELARQLEAQGESINLVAIFEGYAPLRGEQRVSTWRSPYLMLNYIRNMPYWLADYLSLGRKQMWQRIQRKSRNVVKRTLSRLGFSANWQVTDVIDDASYIPPYHYQLMQMHIRAMNSYSPERYQGGVTLFRVRSQSLSRTPDPKMGWQKLANSGVTVHHIDGSHHNILEQPHVQSLAIELKKSLDKAQASS